MADGILIGEISRRTGCTPRTIRHYEAEALFAPVSITPGGRKLYLDDRLKIHRNDGFDCRGVQPDAPYRASATRPYMQGAQIRW